MCEPPSKLRLCICKKQLRTNIISLCTKTYIVNKILIRTFTSVSHARSDLWSGYATKFAAVICPTSKPKILQVDINRSNQFHAHPCHHLLTCPDDDNQWFWGWSSCPYVSHAGSDLWSECDKKSHCCIICPTSKPKILPDDTHISLLF